MCWRGGVASVVQAAVRRQQRHAQLGASLRLGMHGRQHCPASQQGGSTGLPHPTLECAAPPCRCALAGRLPADVALFLGRGSIQLYMKGDATRDGYYAYADVCQGELLPCRLLLVCCGRVRPPPSSPAGMHAVRSAAMQGMCMQCSHAGHVQACMQCTLQSCRACACSAAMQGRCSRAVMQDMCRVQGTCLARPGPVTR